MISFTQALQLTIKNILPLEAEQVGLLDAIGRISAEELRAIVNSPLLDVSLKDGYAVHAQDIANASPENPVQLRRIGLLTAGGSWDGVVSCFEAVRILSGAPVPTGADAVISEEFAQEDDEIVRVTADARVGRNILQKASDIAASQVIVAANKKLCPTEIGLLAAAGHSRIPVIKRPRVAIIATGDEIIAPGRPLPQGKLYASNLVTLAAWCVRYEFDVETFVVGDEIRTIRSQLLECLEKFDVVVTSGGVWTGERDYVVHVLDDIGWKKIYHRVRIGPGKAIGFGLYDDRPVFCLPGGPPSNHMAFLQLALPALQKMAGFDRPGLPTLAARTADRLTGQSDWTQFIHGQVGHQDGNLVFHPIKLASRLQMIAKTEAIAMIPEGQTEIPEGSIIQIQMLLE